jgi:hypothetical protein
MMASGCGDLQGALGAFRPLDVAQVDTSRSWTFGCGRLSTWVPLK